jgi:hypothetical protein
MKVLCVCAVATLLVIPLSFPRFQAESDVTPWESSRLHTLEGTWSGSENPQPDTADLAVEYTSAYPGSEGFLVTVSLQTPASLSAFELYLTLSRPDLINFSTVSIYVDSMDTCPAEEETCWAYFPMRECLAVPGAVMKNWDVFSALGELGDTSKPDCKYLRVLAWDFWDSIPPQPEYVTLFQFGVDILCVPDSLTERALTFFMTGQLAGGSGQVVHLRPHSGDLMVVLSVPGDASADSLVDVSDVIWVVNYLYKKGPEPCVMEAADVNADCQVDLADAVYLLNFLFKGGSPPQSGCAH